MAKKAVSSQSTVRKALTEAFERTVATLFTTYFLARVDSGDPPDQTALEKAGERFKRGLTHAKAALEETIKLSSEV